MTACKGVHPVVPPVLTRKYIRLLVLKGDIQTARAWHRQKDIRIGVLIDEDRQYSPMKQNLVFGAPMVSNTIGQELAAYCDHITSTLQ
ncbi:hypothetical protein RO3G_16923 [Rhizopus delemar RA 99-880]|uniref:Uncharacterized protein n=1 Tax=Rhizopus delemar (strain RA 99-880 / ATCC MYA-4621 / FGSC 9543 / NRRL 43880) TaxID=246409 RepID=I1CVC1_RHIO9|nr:hypothetical protein RO3G_16923 [Rhizopus delemar RA 99-880]|eukprot:EIE92401.1 hypothetical protein RO3G_16923 [Rhizopus delemar RA 99-880]